VNLIRERERLAADRRRQEREGGWTPADRQRERLRRQRETQVAKERRGERWEEERLAAHQSRQAEAALWEEENVVVERPWWAEGRKVSPWWVVVAITIVAVGFLGFHHVVLSGEGTRVIPKVHFTLAETFVSLDAITGMPFIAARTKYPLTVKALQREGMLETDEQFERRVRQETEAEMEQARRRAEEEWRRRW
jgi:hypothetical protein